MGTTASSASSLDAHAVGVAIASPVTSPRTSKRETECLYTLVFPHTNANGSVGAAGRVRYADALATLRAVTGGGKEREARVVSEFRAAWIAKFRTPAPAPDDAIPWRYFQELMRELILQRFDAIPDLFLQTAVADDGQSLLLSFRPSNALLCATADRLRLRVAILDEVDPGERYWAADPTRAVAEAHQWSRTDAQEELYRLFLAGKIPAQEAQLFDDEDPGMWSRRLHALRRFVDPAVKTAVADSEHPTTFLPFKHRASLRYLYRQIDGGSDDATPFRVVDQIRLTKAIIDREFDCDALVEQRLLVHHCCLHTHHTDSMDTSIDVLRAQWGGLTSPWRLYRQGLVRLARILHFQPLAHVRNYFGEELALYFAYTSFYAHALQWLCGIAYVVAFLQATLQDASYHRWLAIAFATGNGAFAQAFVRKWELQERVHATHWGVSTLQDADVPRPQFRGELAISPITHHLETFYSPQRRYVQQLASTALLVILCLALVAVDVLVLTSDAYATAETSYPIVTHVAVAAVAKILTGPCAALCMWLTEWENYRSQQDHDVSLTLKFAVVQSVNLFGVLWLETFVLSLHVDDTNDRLERPAHLLLTFLAVELALSLWDLRFAVVQTCLALLPTWRLSDRTRLLDRSSSSSVTAELALDPYEGVMFDYAQVMMTFGLVAWFAALAPLATVLAWAVAVLQIRVDAFKLCDLTQRQFPTQKNSIGSWGAFLRFLALGAWVHNAMVSVMVLASATPAAWHDLQALVFGGAITEAARLATETRVLVTFVGFGVVAWLACVDDPRDRAERKRLQRIGQRQHFLENKYIHNLDRVPDAVRDGLPPGRVFLNGVHLYVVTGNQADEDAAEEILDELVQLQRQSLHLERQIADLRASDAAVGTLVVEVGSINILPVMDALTKAVDSFLQLQLSSAKKKDRAVNTSVLKKQRSPTWSESFELTLRSLDDDLVVRVYDWELLGKNRRIGQATLRVADIVATAPPAPESPRAVAAVVSEADSPSPSPPPSPLRPVVRMASFEIAIDMPNVLLSSMHADLVRHGHPKLSLRCGVQLDALGRLLLQQRNLSTKIQQLQEQEKQFFEWKA